MEKQFTAIPLAGTALKPVLEDWQQGSSGAEHGRPLGGPESCQERYSSPPAVWNSRNLGYDDAFRMQLSDRNGLSHEAVFRSPGGVPELRDLGVKIESSHPERGKEKCRSRAVGMLS
jgi:hypothetical protein